jgi:F-box-like
MDKEDHKTHAVELMFLPDIVLLKILLYLPCRVNVSQVCKRFYELVCEVDGCRKIVIDVSIKKN